MPTSPNLNALVDLLYEAAVDPTAWEPFLDAVAREFGGAMPGIEYVVAEQGGDGDKMTHGCDDDAVVAFDSHFFRHQLQVVRDSGITSGCHTLRELHELGGNERFESWEFYADWLRPQGANDNLMCFGVREARFFGFGIHALRGRTWGSDELAALNVLRPHLSRALSIRDRVLQLTTERDAAMSLLDQLQFGVLLLSESGRLLAASRPAERFASARDGLRTGATCGLQPESSADRATLGRLLRQALEAWRGDHLLSGGAMTVARPSGLRPYQLVVTRLPRERFRIGRQSAAVAIFVSDPEEAPIAPAECLQQIYGLTPAEAEIAALLAAGEGLEAAAERRGVRIQTARNQLKQVFAKTETRSQSQLVALLLRSNPPLAWRTAR